MTDLRTEVSDSLHRVRLRPRPRRPRLTPVAEETGAQVAAGPVALSTPVPDARPRTGQFQGAGVRLVDPEGREFLDAASGTFNLPLGYDHPRVLEAVAAQLQLVTHVGSEFSRERASRFGESLIAEAPAGIGASWIRDVTGSTAVECAVKVAQKATGKRDVISLFLSHHGQTALTTSLSGSAFRRASFPDLGTLGVIQVPAPYCRRCFFRKTYPACDLLCVDQIPAFIDHASSGRVAAVIVEPVLGNGGNIVPPPDYFTRLREVCDDMGLLLIVDEVQTGLGRTGHFYACETFGIEPDIMVLAKGLGGIGLPVDVLEPFEHSFTSGGNMLALAAAEATVAVIRDGSFLAEVRRKGQVLGRLLGALADRHEIVAEARGVGLMWGLEIVDANGEPSSDLTNRIIARARNDGMILRGSRYGFGNVVKVRPALVATEPDLELIVERLDRSVATVASEGPAA
jgi:4-aminobutyrate aminotransferase-like enzyme